MTLLCGRFVSRKRNKSWPPTCGVTTYPFVSRNISALSKIQVGILSPTVIAKKKKKNSNRTCEIQEKDGTH
jgi:hypothetical protein